MVIMACDNERRTQRGNVFHATGARPETTRAENRRDRTHGFCRDKFAAPEHSLSPRILKHPVHGSAQSDRRAAGCTLFHASCDAAAVRSERSAQRWEYRILERANRSTVSRGRRAPCRSKRRCGVPAVIRPLVERVAERLCPQQPSALAPVKPETAKRRIIRRLGASQSIGRAAARSAANCPRFPWQWRTCRL